MISARLVAMSVGRPPSDRIAGPRSARTFMSTIR